MNGAIRLAPYLTSDCADRLDAQCSGRWCRQAVKQHPATGRWFITDGHPGALSPVNLRAGFQSKPAAAMVMRDAAALEAQPSLAFGVESNDAKKARPFAFSADGLQSSADCGTYGPLTLGRCAL